VNTPTLSTLETFAREAGEIIRHGFNRRPGFGNHLQIDYKGEIDLVTEIDKRSETYILGEIQRLFPNDAIVAEESGAIPGHNGSVWHIDPLDGTINFAHGLPIFAVSIAYQHEGVIKLGVVYDPIQDECFSAEHGEGAWLNGEPIRTSATLRLEESLIATGFPYDIRTNPQNNLEYYSRFTLHSQSVRRLGAAAIDLCYVAAGRLDGFWELRISSWDVAAGGLIAREAGALVTTMHNEPDFLNGHDSILAANPTLHAQMLALIKNGQ